MQGRIHVSTRLKKAREELERLMEGGVDDWSKLQASNDEAEPKHVAKIREYREKGLSYDMVARRLNKGRHPTLSGRGKWHAASVREEALARGIE